MATEAPPSTPSALRPRPAVIAVAIGIDVACTVAFAGAGRQSHDEGTGASDVVATAAPFLLALGVGWLLVRAWRRPAAVSTGVALWPITVALGMLLRRTVFDRGTALSFVIVATAFVGLYLIGWRLIAREITARRAIDDAHAERLG